MGDGEKSPGAAVQVRSQGKLVEWLTERFGGVWVIWSGFPADSPWGGAGMVAAQGTENEAGRYVLTGMLVFGNAVTADSLRKLPVATIENSLNRSVGTDDKMRAELAELPPLQRTPGMTPEDFSRLVAQHYNIWAKYAQHPAASIAADLGAKIPTVHTWVREARLRGFLPPAQRRKAAKK